MLKHTAQCIRHVTNLPATLLTKKVDLQTQQIRNTFILKRKNPPGLHKKNQRLPPMKARHFIYELVEDTNIRKAQQVDMILLKDVKNVGIAGERITMNSEKAHNNLLLPKLAVYATPENIEKYMDNTLTEEDTKSKYSSINIPRTIKFLSHLDLTIMMSNEVPWTLEKWHVRASFRKAGIIVPEDAITMPEKEISGPDQSIEQKLFLVGITINNLEHVKVKCRIYHWNVDENKRKTYEIPPWLNFFEALFPEEQAMIDSLPKHHLVEEQMQQGK